MKKNQERVGRNSALEFETIDGVENENLLDF